MFSTRKAALAALLGAALVACGSSSDDSDDQGSGGSGGSGGGGEHTNACSQTKCHDPYAMSDAACDQTLASSCATVAKDYFACALAHDECLADRTQNHSKVNDSCWDKLLVYTGCFAGDGGTD